MVFTSLNFLIFFPVVVGIYFLLPNRLRWLHLLVASYYFYMAWKPVYALLLFFSTLTFYLAALGVEKFQDKGIWEKLCFFSGIAVNLGMLFTFKYYNFFEEQARALGLNFGINLHLPALDILLPMGISFYTFQGISYLVDVYRRQLTAEHHFGLMLLYKAYFPLLVAGPIERGIHFIPQLRKVLLSDNAHRIRFEYDRVVSGLRLMLLGFFKKIVLADNFAMIVQPVYAAPDEFSGTSALVATLAFAFQIFFDFSAYTDIARGVSRVLGFEMIENFNRPYFATSIPDFWRRWHISLSSWFRDYLYLPLGGNRVAKWRWFLNLWIVFILCGFWHGANWTFLAWGALHGLYYFLTYTLSPPAEWVVAHTALSRFPKICRVILITITFAMVAWAWVVFRAESIAQAVIIWHNIMHIPVEIFGYLRLVFYEGVLLSPLKALGLGWLFRPVNRISLMPLYVFALTAVYLVISFRLRQQDDGPAFAPWNVMYRWGAYVFAIAGILLLGRFGATPFIYFQF
jgi:alginate O-acetyltransferase complex protein AlgI